MPKEEEVNDWTKDCPVYDNKEETCFMLNEEEEKAVSDWLCDN